MAKYNWKKQKEKCKRNLFRGILNIKIPRRTPDWASYVSSNLLWPHNEPEFLQRILGEWHDNDNRIYRPAVPDPADTRQEQQADFTRRSAELITGDISSGFEPSFSDVYRRRDYVRISREPIQEFTSLTRPYLPEPEDYIFNRFDASIESRINTAGASSIGFGRSMVEPVLHHADTERNNSIIAAEES